VLRCQLKVGDRAGHLRNVFGLSGWLLDHVQDVVFSQKNRVNARLAFPAREDFRDDLPDGALKRMLAHIKYCSIS
jgi:hypothetical protein